MRFDPRTWFVLLTCTSTAAASGESHRELRAPDGGGFTTPTGVYFEVHGTWAQLGGDFDGDTGLQGSTDTIALPDADSGIGLGLAIGYRWQHQALELAFTQTEHDGSIPGLSGGDVTYGALDVDWRYFFRTQEQFQPFVQAGLGAAVATLADASSGSSGIGDADLSGVEFALGGGAEYYLDQHWSLGTRLLYRGASFDTAEGVDGDEGSIDDSLDADGLVFSLGVTFTL
jgi:opacity protein-like surface antigen